MDVGELVGRYSKCDSFRVMVILMAVGVVEKPR